MRGLIHGLPGTGKSKVIAWISAFVEEALGWTNGEQFMCVAFQNRMAAAINGSTLHAAADLPRPGEDREQQLSHGDIDHLFIQNERMRWVLVDEISMISDTLLGEFEHQISSAASRTRYHTRKDKTQRIFGGYNMLFFGDWW